MQTLELIGSYETSKLMDELISAIPTFLRTTPGQRGELEALDDSGEVGENPAKNGVIIRFADDILAADITAVTNSHDPTPIPHRDFKADYAAATNDGGRLGVIADRLGLR